MQAVEDDIFVLRMRNKNSLTVAGKMIEKVEQKFTQAPVITIIKHWRKLRYKFICHAVCDAFYNIGNGIKIPIVGHTGNIRFFDNVRYRNIHIRLFFQKIQKRLFYLLFCITRFVHDTKSPFFVSFKNFWLIL